MNNLIQDLLYCDSLIDIAISQAIEITNKDLLNKPEYGLFYLIRENYQINIDLLNKTNIEYDSFGFAGGKRNTRVSIEALLDLYNLKENYKYITVMKKHCNEEMDQNENQEYNKIMKSYNFDNGYVSFKTKNDIASINGLNDEFNTEDKFTEYLKKYYEKYSDYAHPNIFIINNDIGYKERECKDLIILNLQMMGIALKYISYIICLEYEKDNKNKKYLERHKKDVEAIRSSINSIINTISNDNTRIFEYVNIN